MQLLGLEVGYISKNTQMSKTRVGPSRCGTQCKT